MSDSTVSPFRQDPLSRCRVRVHTALAIVEDGSYGLLKFEDVARLLIMALDDIAELEQGQAAPQGLDWNEYPALAEEGR
ncbi:MAG: hypothetical protein ABW007_27260 [Chitinophagaceae bacterium]